MTGLDKLGAGDQIFPGLQDGFGWLEGKVAVRAPFCQFFTL